MTTPAPAAAPLRGPEKPPSRPAGAGVALRPEHYLDPRILALEQQRIFERSWQLAGHVSDLPRPGSYLTAQAGTQPVLVGDLSQRLEPYAIPALERFAEFSGSGQPANWKVVAENYLEGYHIPIAHPDLMRLVEYKRYSVEVHEDWVWFESPLRARPAGNRRARLYARLVEPMAGLGPDDRHVWRYAFVYPNTAIDLYPDQVTTWQILPDGVGRTSDVFGSYRPRHSGPRTRLVQRLNQRFNSRVLDEDVDLVDNVQRGLATTGYECGPLSAREAAVAWLADRVRRDLSG